MRGRSRGGQGRSVFFVEVWGVYPTHWGEGRRTGPYVCVYVYMCICIYIYAA